MSEHLDLYDYRCRVAAIYRERKCALVAGEDAATVLQRFREQRDELFAHHPQSAFDEEQRATFGGLRYFPYNPAGCCEATLDTDVEHAQHNITMNASETMKMTTVGHLHFMLGDRTVTLALYWLDVYGGGLFLPFRDATSPAQSYGGGRYLFDTMKGSDFLLAPNNESRIVLDFNYAYNPSCAYNYRWTCPLAPTENRLAVSIAAGEMNYTIATSDGNTAPARS
ncbi:MAG TPA: DUF1684 domain-containing protein [Ktedonobacteraceae bacterium]|nr:DUF1684 domain-containing protein [Ktedonobacteraceae bacterium]